MSTNITNQDFVEFLKSLGVDSGDVSFDWILNDPQYSSVLQWLYCNINENNVLDAREESRYEEMEKNGELLSEEELESTILSIREKYPGIVLPVEQDRLESMELEHRLNKDRLALLNEQEKIFQKWAEKNELLNENLTKEIYELKEKENQFLQDERELSDQCLNLAQEIQTVRDSIMVMVGERLKLYSNCISDKKVAEQFITFGPIDEYRKQQTCFSRAVQTRVQKVAGNHVAVDECGSDAIKRAKKQEDLLLRALMNYAMSKAEVEGEKAALQAMDSFVLEGDTHDTSVSDADTDMQQWPQHFEMAAQRLASDRTALVKYAVLQSALALRLDVSSSLRATLEAMAGALRVDAALCEALRDELLAARDTAALADQLRDLEQRDAQDVRGRMESMKSICSELSSCSSRLHTSEPAMAALTALLADFNVSDVSGVSDVGNVADVGGVARLFRNIDRRQLELKEEVLEACDGTQAALLHVDNTRAELQRAVQAPDVCEAASASVTEPSSLVLTSNMEGSVRRVSRALEAREVDVERVRELYTTLSREQVMRKLWQWFLADPAKLTERVCHKSAV